MMSSTIILAIAIGLLMVDSIIELAFISSMVSWLHQSGSRDFEIFNAGSTFALHAVPQYLLVNQGHTSNGAAGTAFVLIGLGGILALWLRSRRNSKIPVLAYNFWAIMTVLSMLLTLTALIYTFVITANHHGQSINLTLAQSLDEHLGASAYSGEAWTPENWYTAVLELDLASSSDRGDISRHLEIMKAWRYNLIPMFVVGLVVCVLAVVDRNAGPKGKGGYSAVATKKTMDL